MEIYPSIVLGALEQVIIQNIYITEITKIPFPVGKLVNNYSKRNHVHVFFWESNISRRGGMAGHITNIHLQQFKSAVFRTCEMCAPSYNSKQWDWWTVSMNQRGLKIIEKWFWDLSNDFLAFVNSDIRGRQKAKRSIRIRGIIPKRDKSCPRLDLWW